MLDDLRASGAWSRGDRRRRLLPLSRAGAVQEVRDAAALRGGARSALRTQTIRSRDGSFPGLQEKEPGHVKPSRPDNRPTRTCGGASSSGSIAVGGGGGRRHRKTTLLVQRALAILASPGASIESLAIMTFTEKRPESSRSDCARGSKGNPRGRRTPRSLQPGAEAIDRATVTTIHAFAASLLRERPVEAGVDPRFRCSTPWRARSCGTRSSTVSGASP